MEDRLTLNQVLLRFWASNSKILLYNLLLQEKLDLKVTLFQIDLLFILFLWRKDT